MCSCADCRSRVGAADHPDGRVDGKSVESPPWTPPDFSFVTPSPPWRIAEARPFEPRRRRSPISAPAIARGRRCNPRSHRRPVRLGAVDRQGGAGVAQLDAAFMGRRGRPVLRGAGAVRRVWHPTRNWAPRPNSCFRGPSQTRSITSARSTCCAASPARRFVGRTISRLTSWLVELAQNKRRRRWSLTRRQPSQSIRSMPVARRARAWHCDRHATPISSPRRLH